MKLSGNIESPFVQSIRMYIDEFGRKKMQVIVTVFFLFGSFFLSQAVLFGAAVPFFLPVWALARARFRKQLIWVFIGGMAGSVFLDVGQAVIHLLQLLLFNAAIRYPFTRKSVPLTVVSSIFIVQVLWQLVAYGGHIPMEVQLFVGFEVILAFFMTFFFIYCFSKGGSIFLSTVDA